MKHVPVQWLRRFQLVLLGLDVVVFGLYLYKIFVAGVPAAEQAMEGVHSHGSVGLDHSSLGITLLVVMLAAFHAVYCLGVVWWLDKRHIWLTHAIGLLAWGVLLVMLANSDSSIHNVYHFLLMVFMFFAAMNGALVIGVTFMLAFGLLIFGSLGSGHLISDPSGHVVEMVLVSLSALSGSGGWFIFSKRYTEKADFKVVESLTSLVKQERTTVNLILESITDGVMIISTKGAVEVLNVNSAKMLGWPKEEAQNLQYTYLLPVTTKTEEDTTPDTSADLLPIGKALKNGKPEQGVCLIKTRDGRQVYMDITASPIFQEEKALQGAVKKLVGVIAVLRDVDKQKREQEQRSEFISTASHEMRTPVAAIEGYLALALNSKVSGIDAKARSYLEKAHESTQHLGKLFQDLLTSARAEDGRLVSHPEVIETGQYLEQMTESLRFAAEKKGLTMDFTIGAGSQAATGNMNGKVIRPLYYVHADPDRIREVITNIFDNAVKYTETGRISIGLTGNDELVQLYIRDTGPGIPPDDLPHLFQKFYRVDNSATRTIGGTGLGLFISRKIVELYKGRIWAESQLKQGSTFYINLPRLSNQKAAELQATEAAQAANSGALSS